MLGGLPSTGGSSWAGSGSLVLLLLLLLLLLLVFRGAAHRASDEVGGVGPPCLCSSLLSSLKPLGLTNTRRGGKARGVASGRSTT